MPPGRGGGGSGGAAAKARAARRRASARARVDRAAAEEHRAEQEQEEQRKLRRHQAAAWRAFEKTHSDQVRWRRQVIRTRDKSDAGRFVDVDPRLRGVAPAKTWGDLSVFASGLQLKRQDDRRVSSVWEASLRLRLRNAGSDWDAAALEQELGQRSGLDLTLRPDPSSVLQPEPEPELEPVTRPASAPPLQRAASAHDLQADWTLEEQPPGVFLDDGGCTVWVGQLPHICVAEPRLLSEALSAFGTVLSLSIREKPDRGSWALATYTDSRGARDAANTGRIAFPGPSGGSLNCSVKKATIAAHLEQDGNDSLGDLAAQQSRKAQLAMAATKQQGSGEGGSTAVGTRRQLRVSTSVPRLPVHCEQDEEPARPPRPSSAATRMGAGSAFNRASRTVSELRTAAWRRASAADPPSEAAQAAVAAVVSSPRGDEEEREAGDESAEVAAEEETSDEIAAADSPTWKLSPAYRGGSSSTPLRRPYSAPATTSRSPGSTRPARRRRKGKGRRVRGSPRSPMLTAWEGNESVWEAESSLEVSGISVVASPARGRPWPEK